MSDDQVPRARGEAPDPDLTPLAEGSDRLAGPRPMARVTALPSVAESPAPLPESLSSFIGREQDVATVVTLLEDPAVRLLTLTGPGGIGKTRLATATATAARERFADGVAFVALDAVHQAEQVVPSIAQALGLRERTSLTRRQQLQTFLRSRQLLLVLDNFEQVLAAGPEVAALVSAASKVTALITSRAPLRVSGERELPLAPLTLPGEHATAAELLASDAGRLFVERAQAHAPAFTVDDDAAPVIADICARLDGLPLAIELAAARANVLPPRQLRARLEHRLPLLTHGARNAPPRHGTMRDAIAWSYDLLPPAEQRLFQRLAVFDGGITLEAAEYVGGDPSPPKRSDPPFPPSVLDMVSALVEQSLLGGGVGLAGESRFRMLETIRAFGLERLAAVGEEEHARAMHAHYFLSLARALRPWITSHARQAPLDQLAADHANLQAALGWLDTRGPAADFAELAAALSEYWLSLSLMRDGQHWLGRALASIDAASAPDQGRLLAGYAEMLMGQGQFTQAEPYLTRALPLSRAANDPLDTAWVLILTGSLLNGGGHYGEAETPFHEALNSADQIADPALRAALAGRVLANLSLSARAQGDFARVTAYSEDALRRYDGRHLDLAESIWLMELGTSAFAAGDYDLAVERWREGLALTSERGDMRLVSDGLTEIACVATAWGEHRAALLLFGAADALRERVGTATLWPFDVAVYDRALAALRHAVGEPVADATLAEGRALSLAEAIVITSTVGQAAIVDAAPRSGDSLTRREKDVLHLLTMQQTDQEIADALFLSRRTASWHVRRVLAKLGVASRAEAVARARTDGLII